MRSYWAKTNIRRENKQRMLTRTFHNSKTRNFSMYSMCLHKFLVSRFGSYYSFGVMRI